MMDLSKQAPPASRPRPPSKLCCVEGCGHPGSATSATSRGLGQDDDRSWYCRHHYRSRVLKLGANGLAKMSDEARAAAREWLEVLRKQIASVDLCDWARKTRTERAAACGDWSSEDEARFRARVAAMGRGDLL